MNENLVLEHLKTAKELMCDNYFTIRDGCSEKCPAFKRIVDDYNGGEIGICLIEEPMCALRRE